ncbi:Caveolae-associated protein 1 [Bienertia sinuspersici]
MKKSMLKLNLRAKAIVGIVVRDECEKFQKEANKLMNEADEAKNKEISANDQNKILTKKLRDVERENKVTRHYLEKYLNTLGYNLFEFNMDEDFEESNEEYDNEEDKDKEEISGNDHALYFVPFFKLK